MTQLTKDLFAEARKLYPKGTRVELKEKMQDPHTKLKAGDKATVQFVDDSGTVHCRWDNGEGLGLIIGVDAFKVIE
ncbi:MAG: DUF4314 domain-containing protein [Firmicutes bacterium]|nr:DUF4314 domain-containing protein [Bacillota bacterium]